jgi:pimeloyl-ACP methyl ester carboxylesterase
MIDVLILPGTGFPRGDGISLAFADALDPSKFRPRIVEYAAAYGGLTMPYAQSRQAGRRALLEAMNGPFILAGYSQGAGIAGDLAVEIARHMPGAIADSVRGCALIADPRRPAGAGMPAWPIASGYGIAGGRDVIGVPTWWAAAEGDPITALPPGNPLRSVADLTEWWSIASPADVLLWGADLVQKSQAGRFQRWWSLSNRQHWSGALAYARGYLIDGRHTTDYLRLGHVQALAHTVNREEF